MIWGVTIGVIKGDIRLWLMFAKKLVTTTRKSYDPYDSFCHCSYPSDYCYQMATASTTAAADAAGAFSAALAASTGCGEAYDYSPP